MEDHLNKMVIGQEDAVKAMAKCIRLSRAGLRHHDAPLGVFFFLGSSGVGKTELPKALTQFLFQDVNALIKLDMSCQTTWRGIMLAVWSGPRRDM